MIAPNDELDGSDVKALGRATGQEVRVSSSSPGRFLAAGQPTAQVMAFTRIHSRADSTMPPSMPMPAV
jgi:hypothetical protein